MKAALFVILFTRAFQVLACELEDNEIFGAYRHIEGENFFEEFIIEDGWSV